VSGLSHTTGGGGAQISVEPWRNDENRMNCKKIESAPMALRPP
jgi:hypothetical protein